ncbi:ATP-dependent 6-phosphofructokinase 4, chloroplastic isoform X3 [Citrus clementina]|uniref:ATP-dependent 6-phosphofructokinase 4, chloroplastic isoform X3 n=1 Tax=Citrus clementina TaxID=85681 RepID=UPI000CED6B9D|nr:ATP-dependent 6-phosphofructokinase 4, chloroplastic isoform X3 [Citrus x clementina]
MDHSISSRSLSRSPSPSISPFNSKRMILNPVFHKFNFDSRNFEIKPLVSRQNRPVVVAVRSSNQKVHNDGFVLEDVPHLTNFLPDLPIVIQKDSPRGVHFRRAGPREKVYFKSDEVRACIVTCGGLCPGINTVIREIVCGLSYMYGVDEILGIEGGYRGFYSKNTLTLSPKVVNDIHKRGGTILRTSRGGHDTNKIVDNIEDRGINQVYIIGGDGTQKGAALIYKEVEKRGLQVAVAGIPKTIDNDIAVIDKSFGFDTAVEEAQRAINAAHVEVESVENGVGIVKLMGRYSGFISMYATLASRDVDCCLIPESPFYLEGPGGLFEFIERQLKENGHMVIVVAEGAGQEFVAQSMPAVDEKDASGNRLLLDIGLWLTQKIKDHFTKVQKMTINMKYIDPTYMIRAIPSNGSDNIYCTLLAHSAVHGAMAGFTGFTVGPVNSRHAYIPIAKGSDPYIRQPKNNQKINAEVVMPNSRVTETQKTVKLTDRMWARLLASTNQPSFLNCSEVLHHQEKAGRKTTEVINSERTTST